LFSNFSSELYDVDDVVLVEVVAVAVSPFTPVDASDVTKCFEERGENNEDVREGDLDDVDDDEINARIDDGVIMLNASAAGIVSVTITHTHTHTHILRLILILKDAMMDTVN
jgi:hypothetical protein